MSAGDGTAQAPDDVVDELYGAPLDEFVGLRDARAKELRAAGRRSEADAVKRLRKPRVPAWAVNRIARQDPDAIDGLIAAGAALRQAKAGALRTAAREEREAVEQLVELAVAALREAGQAASPAAVDEIRDTLHAAAIDPEARELVAAGRVLEPLRAVGFGGLAGAAIVEEPSGERARSRRKPAERERAERALAEAREAVRAARSEVRERERSLRTAERDLSAAERAADDARADLEAARERLERRESALGQATERRG